MVSVVAAAKIPRYISMHGYCLYALMLANQPKHDTALPRGLAKIGKTMLPKLCG